MVIKEKDLMNRMKIQEMRVEKMKKEIEGKNQNLVEIMDKAQEQLNELVTEREVYYNKIIVLIVTIFGKI